MDEPLTEDERQTLKAAAFGAVYLVSNADPGFFNVIRESFAASGVFAGAAGLVREVLTGGGLPRFVTPGRPDGDAAGSADTEAYVVSALRDSVAILAAKAPHELGNYQAAVAGAVDRVAATAGGVSAREAAMVAKVKQALAR